MLRLKFIIFLTMAIFFAQLQCVAGCATRPCHDELGKTDSASPCHKHHDHGHEHDPGSCVHHALISPASLPLSVQVAGATCSIAELPESASALVPSKSQLFSDRAFESSPPPLQGSSTSVLRI